MVAHVHGEIDEDVDFVGTNAISEEFVAHAEGGDPMVGVFLEASG